MMKYISLTQIQEAIKVLRPHNAFFATTFFVLKEAMIPIGGKNRFPLDTETERFLNEHYKVHPKSAYFFRVMRKSDLNKDWLKPNYASHGLQSVNTRTFRDALLHDRNDNTWGWKKDYVEQLAKLLPRGNKIPLFHIAAWLYRTRQWPQTFSRQDVVRTIISEYHLTTEELTGLFHVEVLSEIPANDAFQALPVKWHEILAPFSLPKDVPAENSGILRYLETELIGPLASMVFEPAKRLNLITGDNGLGKTFLLDLAWWALTRDWAERAALPFTSTSKTPAIKFSVGSHAESRPVKASFSFSTGTWEVKEKLPALSGLVIYARLDGSFAVWDPANRALSGGQGGAGRWPGLKFTRDQVWDGDSNQIEGLIRDWVKWQSRPDLYPAYDTFQAILKRVSPPDLGELKPGDPMRIHGSHRDIPTLQHPYGTVPILFESAGIRRILTLAYLLVWAWEEHKIQAKQQKRPEERQIVVIVDEAEAHLHPKWQRVILPALLGVAQDLHAELSAQWLIASHSPLVLASAESVWDEDQDRLFHLDMTKAGNVRFAQIPFEFRGSVDSWLSSEVFDLKHPGSRDRETAIREAIKLQEAKKPTKAQVEHLTAQLREVLAPEDPFWVRWVFFAGALGVEVS